MKRMSSLLIVIVMIVTMIPTAFAADTTGFTGISAMSALFLNADLQDVYDAYDVALDYIDDPTTFYAQAPETLRTSIGTELPQPTFNALYDGTVTALSGQSQESKSEVFDALAGVVKTEASDLIAKINAMDLTLTDGSKVGTVVYYMTKLAQEKKIATYNTYTDKLVFDLGRIPGSTLVELNSGLALKYGSNSDTYLVSDVAEAVFSNMNADFDGVMTELEAHLNMQLAAYLSEEDANSEKMVNALKAFGFLHEYSTKPSTGGGGGGFVPILPPEPVPENPGVVGEDALDITTGDVVTQVSVDQAALATAVEEAIATEEGTAVEIHIPEAALPTEVAEQIVVVIPEGAISDLSEAGLDVELNFGGVVLVIPGELFANTEGELDLQVIITSSPTSLEASIGDPGMRSVSVTRGLVPSFDINAIVVEHAGQTRLTDHNASPLHFEYPLDQVLPAYFDTLGLYYYNPETGYYDFVSGRIVEGKLVADLTHLSEYAILNVVTNFTDLKLHWANTYVRSMAAKHVINGDGTGRFLPEDSVTRAEFVKMLVNVENLPLNQAPSFFEDVKKDDWFKPYVDAAYANGLIYGGTSSNFLPEQAATRLEMMVMLSYAIDEEITEEEVESILSAYTDADQISALHRADLAKVIKAGLIEGYNGVLSLNEGLKRSEAATVMYRLFNR